MADEEAVVSESTQPDIVTEEGTEKDQATTAEEQRFSDIDESSLNEEEKKAYKSMQADYTRKTQELARERKALSDKAKAYDDLVANPQVSEVLENIAKYGVPVAPKQEAAKQQELTGDEIILKIIENPNYLSEIIDEQVAKRLAPITEKEAMKEAETMLSSFAKDHPDYTDYESEIIKYVNVGLELEEAYTLAKAKSGAFITAAEKAKANEAREKAALVSKGSNAQAQNEKVVNNINDAFALAAKQHGFKI